MKNILGDIGRNFADGLVKGATAQLHLMRDVRALESASDGAITSQYHALIGEHEEDAQYPERLRKAIEEKLESLQRAADRARKERIARAEQGPGDGGVARIFEHVEDAFDSSRDTKIRKLRCLLSLTERQDETPSRPEQFMRFES